ncbi:MAG: type III secretion protein C [Cellvibrionaceae bacterium]|jgi:type III secretion protein C
MKYLIVTIVAIFFGLGSQISVAQAKAPAAVPGFWKESAYAIECKKTSVSEVLNDFATSFGVSLVVSGRIDGICNGWKRADDVIAFLDHISSEHQLHWFYYKNKLYVSPTSDHKTLRIEAATGFQNALKGLGLFQEKFGWGELEGDGVVIVSGPSQYVNFINKLSEKENEVKQRAANGDIYVFALKHANVSDRTVNMRDKQMIIPGVATILKGLLEGKRTSFINDKNSEGKKGSLSAKSSKKHDSGVYVEGDVRTNSIIIRAKKQDYSFYKGLIEDLDVPGQLIEIDAIIVDISREKLTEIGANFSYTDTSNGGSTTATVNNLANAVFNSGSTVFIKNLDKFYLSLKALEGMGDASIIANTSILTMENQPAIIDLSETVFITTTGERVVDVMPVTAGTLLNVIPQTISTDEGDKIKLVIDIEDGKLVSSGSEGNSTPGIRKTTISTKALIDQNRSLVIGGYHLQSRNRQDSGIPFLKDIPFLGAAFSSKIETSQNQERLFILTPRISPTSHNPEDYSSTGSSALIAEALATIKNRWADASRSYLEKTKHLLAGLASGQIPVGYDLETLKKYKDISFDCLQAGIEYRFEGAQKVVGKGLEAYVGVAINRSDQRLKVEESHCRGKGLIAVSLFPNTVLDAGQATEIFVVMESALMESQRREELTSSL